MGPLYAPVSIPRQFTAVPASENKDKLAAVYKLEGQRWHGEAAWSRALSVLEHEAYKGFVCLWGSEIIGRAGLLKTDGSMAHLKSLFVGDNTRGRGLGRLMISFIANYAIDLGYSWLASEVDVDNVASQRCHANAGFRPVGIIHSYLE